ncbi:MULTISPECIES: PspA/IM30 family protein [Bacillales]|jgi:phage shock protein A|uniref:Phage shock protein A n=1 Tax=Brevibacillus aydinogluensis TaxID=927786 RepID=A0AA48M670_9BACL|nr:MULTISPECIES: PspA/IM30 family protein [Bacillales]REK61848.1 MAG: phage shock protein A [Brevibacillus sp.]MBR8658152.1 PspA/IM30 family protein [Brevibacillus sp. NL20B1]MDT3414812.1 phage shock protein A [Brevibacillus aydinogluensis]NNV01507.1 PspA/IM30 family protein [Brevibacillus sp. MCWH]UFJ61156.1 PspA/IM30 family protein [Anoxybacillus sediminis]
MSFFKRLRDLTMANLYALIEKAEDPVKMTDQYLRDMQADLEEAEKAVAAQIALEKKFKLLYEEQEALVKKRDEQAHLAAQAKNVDLARRALEEKKAAQQKMEEYKASYEQNKQAADNLREKLAEMRKQINELKHKRETLVARVNAAKAQKNINKAMSGFDANTAMAGLKRMEEKALQLEAEAEASGDVYKKETSLDEEIAKLNRDQEIEDELAALMKKYEG